MIERPSLLAISRVNLTKARHLKCYFENEEVLLSEPDPIPGFSHHTLSVCMLLGLNSQVASTASCLVSVFLILSLVIGIVRIYTYISYNREMDNTEGKDLSNSLNDLVKKFWSYALSEREAHGLTSSVQVQRYVQIEVITTTHLCSLRLTPHPLKTGRVA